MFQSESPSSAGGMGGQFRVLGIGRGLDAEDCAQAASEACNAGLDTYWQQQKSMRPVDAPCRALQQVDVCCPTSAE